MGKWAISQRPLCATEARDLIGISVRVMAGWLKDGVLPMAYKTHGDSGHWRLKRAEFLDWLSSYQDGQIRIPRRRKANRIAVPKGTGLADRLRAISL
jgi:hypothetical protein